MSAEALHMQSVMSFLGMPTQNIEETKVTRVGRISQVGDEAKMGALLVILMGFLTKALRQVCDQGAGW